jgi:hypothetical protein
VGAVKRLMNSGVKMQTAIERLSKLDWRFESPDWDRIAVEPGNKIIQGTQRRKLLSRVISYRLGETLSSKELGILEEQYRSLFDQPNKDRQLPEKIF